METLDLKPSKIKPYIYGYIREIENGIFAGIAKDSNGDWKNLIRNEEGQTIASALEKPAQNFSNQFEWLQNFSLNS